MLSILLFGIILGIFTYSHRTKIPLNRLRPLSWFIFSPLLLIEFIPASWLVSGLLGQSAAQTSLVVGFTYLGISYSAIRCFMMVREEFENIGPTPLQALTAFLFFGHFIAGPISGAQPWRTVSSSLSVRDVIIAFSRIFWGGALFFVLKAYVENFDANNMFGINTNNFIGVWISIYQDFLVLFIDFAGYSEIAIGTAMLYGVRLPENFNWPLRATSIQEFWQRWHLSLGKFINTYLFRAVVREVGKPSLAIFFAFTVVGLWHNLSLPYLVWGLGHGLALAANMTIRKLFPLRDRPKIAQNIMPILGWVFTMSYVSLLSAFANEPDIWSALNLLRELTP